MSTFPSRSSQAAQLEGLAQISATHIQHAEHSFQALAARHPLLSLHARVQFETCEQISDSELESLFRVRDARLGREATLRLLKPASGAELKERFVRAASLTARLDHPAIPPIYEAGMTVEGQLYSVMRALEGETLAARIERVHSDFASAQDLRDLLQVFVRVCEAVAYAHSQDVVHRDLKPEHVVIGEFGEVFVTGWERARDLREAGDLDEKFARGFATEQASGSQDFVGTAGYAAPEQVEGEARARADVFALGAVLFELLTGQAAIPGHDDEARVAATLAEDWRALPKIAGLRRDMAWIVDGCLCELSERTASVEELRAQVDDWLADRPLEACPYSLRERVLRRFRRRPLLWSSVSFFLVMVSMTAVLALLLRLQQQQSWRAERVLKSINQARFLAQRRAPEEQIKAEIETMLRLGQSSEEVLLLAGDVARRRGLKDQARALWQQASERFQPGTKALFQLHLLELDGAGFAMTEPLKELVRRAKAGGEVNEFVLYSRSIEYWQRKDYKRCLEAVSGMRRTSGDFEALYLTVRAMVKALEGKDAEALEDFKEALKRRPGFVDVYAHRGWLQCQRGDAKKGIEDINRLLRVEKQNAAGFFNRGFAKKRLGDIEGALADMSRSLALTELKEVYRERGLIYRDQQKQQLAMRDFQAALRLDPNYEKAHLGLVRCFESLGLLADQMKELDWLVAHAEDKAWALWLRADTRTKRQQWPQALADCEASIKLRQDNAKAYNTRGYVRGQLGDFKGAFEDFARSIEEDPKQAAPYFNRGRCRQARGNIDGALEDFSEALKYKVDDPEIFNMRGFAYYRKDDFAKALADFEMALKLSPGSEKYRLNRGHCRAHLSDYQGALKDYQAVLREGHPQEQGIRKRIREMKALIARGGVK